MKYSPLFAFLPSKTGFKPYIYQGNSFLKKYNFLSAWTCYENAAKSLFDNWGKFSNNYYWPENTFFINDKYRFLYCPIPKVASSSFTNLLYKLSSQNNVKKKEVIDTIV